MFFEDLFTPDEPDLFDLSISPIHDEDPLSIAIKQDMENSEIPNDFRFSNDEYIGELPDVEDEITENPQSQYEIQPPPVFYQNQVGHQDQIFYPQRETSLNNRLRDSRSTSPADSSTSEGSMGAQSEEEMSTQLVRPPPPSSSRKSSKRNNKSSSKKRRKRKRHEIEEDTKRLAYLRAKKNKSEAEKAELRKLRNRDSAMRSRAKKAKEMKSKDSLISEQKLTIHSLEGEVYTLKTEVGNLKREVAYLQDKNTSLLRKLKIQPGTIYSCAVLLVLFVVLAFVLCKSPFTLGISNYNEEYSIVSQHMDDEYYAPDDYYHRNYFGYDWDDDSRIKALPRSTSDPIKPQPPSSSLVMKDDTEFVYVHDVISDSELHFEDESGAGMCYQQNGMIPVDQKVKITVRDPLFGADLEHLMKKRELTFSEEMYHHFVTNTNQFVYVNSEYFEEEDEDLVESPKPRITSVPPAMTTTYDEYHDYESECDNDCGSSRRRVNGSSYSNDTIFIEDEEDEVYFHVGGEGEEEEMVYRYLRKNESGEVVGYYYSTEDWDNKEVFMTPHIFHLNGNQEFNSPYDDDDVGYHDDGGKYGEEDDDRELILVFPVEQIQGKNGESTGVFKLAEIHIPSKSVHFGESFWSFQPLKGHFAGN